MTGCVTGPIVLEASFNSFNVPSALPLGRMMAEEGTPFLSSTSRLISQLSGTLSPEERGFGMWKRNRIPSLTYVDRLRTRDRRTPDVFLKDMAEDVG